MSAEVSEGIRVARNCVVPSLTFNGVAARSLHESHSLDRVLLSIERRHLPFKRRNVATKHLLRARGDVIGCHCDVAHVNHCSNTAMASARLFENIEPYSQDNRLRIQCVSSNL